MELNNTPTLYEVITSIAQEKGSEVPPNIVVQALHADDIMRRPTVCWDSGDEYPRDPTDDEINRRIEFFGSRLVPDDQRTEIERQIREVLNSSRKRSP